MIAFISVSSVLAVNNVFSRVSTAQRLRRCPGVVVYRYLDNRGGGLRLLALLQLRLPRARCILFVSSMPSQINDGFVLGLRHAGHIMCAAAHPRFGGKKHGIPWSVTPNMELSERPRSEILIVLRPLGVCVCRLLSTTYCVQGAEYGVHF